MSNVVVASNICRLSEDDFQKVLVELGSNVHAGKNATFCLGPREVWIREPADGEKPVTVPAILKWH